VSEVRLMGQRSFTGLVRDVTDRKRIERRLREQESLAHLGEMAAVVAHEVKNPLAGISGALQVIGNRMPEGNVDRRVIQDMRKRIASLNESLQDLLTFARPRPMRMSTLDLRKLVLESLTLLGRDNRYAELDVQVDGDAEQVVADGDQLQMVLLNILLNAAQATGEDGSLKVVLSQDGDWRRVAVVDSGPGIPEELREKIFKPFFTTKARGTGLGLAMVRRTVEGHGGQVLVECPEGGGTVVTLVLPADAREHVSDPVRPDDPGGEG